MSINKEGQLDKKDAQDKIETTVRDYMRNPEFYDKKLSHRSIRTINLSTMAFNAIMGVKGFEILNDPILKTFEAGEDDPSVSKDSPIGVTHAGYKIGLLCLAIAEGFEQAETWFKAVNSAKTE